MNNYWTTIEIDTLCRHYQRLTPEAISALIPGRTVAAITKKAQRLLLKAPTMRSQLITYIKTQPSSASSTARSFGCSVRTVYRVRKAIKSETMKQ